MKKCFVLVFVMALVSAIFVNAAAPDAMTTSNPFCEKWLSSASTYYGHSDSLNGSDSVWLYKGIVPEIGKEYNFIIPSITGDGSDSVKIYVFLDCYDGTTLIERFSVDTITTAPTTAAPEKIALPFGQVIFGTKYNLVLKTYTGHGGKCKLNNVCGFKASVVEQKHMVTY